MRACLMSVVLCACGCSNPSDAIDAAFEGIDVRECGEELKGTEPAPADTRSYGPCHSLKPDGCAGEAGRVCIFARGQNPEWSVCSQQCWQDRQCPPAREARAAQPECKSIFCEGKPGACVLDCSHGDPCPSDMYCWELGGFCVHPRSE